MLITSEQRRQHDAWRIRRERVEHAPFVARPRPVVKTIDVRPKSGPEPLPMLRVDQILAAAGPPDDQLLPPARSARDIAAEVAGRYDLPIRSLMSTRRSANIVQARNEAYYRIREETALSLPQIGRLFDKDHTTILHGIRRHEARIAVGQA